MRLDQINRELNFHVDRLENRRLLAADVAVRSDNLNIIADNEANFIEVYKSEGTVHVYADGQTTDTGLVEIKNLKIVTKDSGEEIDEALRLGGGPSDFIQIDNDVVVNGRTLINMGPGNNELDFGGLHNRVRIVGGRDTDYVNLAGGIGTKTNVISTRGGEDTVTLELSKYAEAVLDGGPLAEYLEDVAENVDLDDPSAAFRLIPKIRGNLGGGDDTFRVTLDGDPISDGDLLDAANLAADFLGLDPFDNLDDAAAFIEEMASDFGLRLPRFLNISGGGGSDTMDPPGFGTIIDLFGSFRSFEQMVMPT